MSKFNIEAFENLIAAAKESTRKSLESSPFLSQGRARAQALAAGIADVKTTLSFDLLDAPDFDIKSVKVQGAWGQGRQGRRVPHHRQEGA